MPKFYHAAVEKNRGVRPGRILHMIRYIRPYFPIFLNSCEIKSGRGRPGYEVIRVCVSKATVRVVMFVNPRLVCFNIPFTLVVCTMHTRNYQLLQCHLCIQLLLSAIAADPKVSSPGSSAARAYNFGVDKSLYSHCLHIQYIELSHLRLSRGWVSCTTVLQVGQFLLVCKYFTIQVLQTAR